MPKNIINGGSIPSIPLTGKYAAACYFKTPLFIKIIGGEGLPPVFPSPDTALFSIVNNYIGILILHIYKTQQNIHTSVVIECPLKIIRAIKFNRLYFL